MIKITYKIGEPYNKPFTGLNSIGNAVPETLGFTALYGNTNNYRDDILRFQKIDGFQKADDGTMRPLHLLTEIYDKKQRRELEELVVEAEKG